MSVSTDHPGWAVYDKGRNMAIVNVPFRVAQQLARHNTSATIITMAATGRIEHQHELGLTVCVRCAGERETVTV